MQGLQLKACCKINYRKKVERQRAENLLNKNFTNSSALGKLLQNRKSSFLVFFFVDSLYKENIIFGLLTLLTLCCSKYKSLFLNTISKSSRSSHSGHLNIYQVRCNRCYLLIEAQRMAEKLRHQAGPRRWLRSQGVRLGIKDG